MTFGEILATLRKSKGLSQEQLAEELNVARQTVSKWELGQSTPDMDCLSKLSNFFGVSTDYFIKGEHPTCNNSSDAEKACAENKHNIAYQWCFYLGLSMFLMSIMVITVLIICSALNPITATICGKTYTKLLGFLFGTHTLWFFVVLCVILVIGILLSLYGILKNIKPNKNR